jgi:hypothetical protein
LIVVAACGGSGGDEAPTATTAAQASPVVTTLSQAPPAATTAPAAPAPVTAAPTAVTTAAPAATTPADPWAVTEPIEVTVAWDCDGELVDRGGGMLVSACTSGRIDTPWFTEGNWFTSMRYIRDDDGVLVAVEAASSGYSGHCMWDAAEDSTFARAPVADGKATHEGVLFGNGRCEGLRYVYMNTIDIENGTTATTGTLEPIP